MLRAVRSSSPFINRLVSLLVCCGLIISQLSIAIPLAAASEKFNAGNGIARADSLTQRSSSTSSPVGVRKSEQPNTSPGYTANAGLMSSPLPQQSSAAVVISQIYGGGGNTGATYKNDFIELFNRSNTIVDLTGWSVQYAAAGGSTWQVVALTGSLGPGQYYLIQAAQGTSGTADLPAPDASSTVSMNSSAGKVALVSRVVALSGTYPLGDSNIVDFVGYGSTASAFEGNGPTTGPSNISAVLRANNGCTDTDNNSTDFNSSGPIPRNSSSATSPCGGGIPPSTTVVISEFRTRGTGGGYDEFVELYNLSDNPIDISGWKIKASNSTGGVTTRVTVNQGTTLPARGHFLATHNSASGYYTGAVQSDQTYNSGIPDNGGIALVMPDETVVDRVGMSNGSAFKESRSLEPLTGNTEQSYERKPGGGSGSSQDTNDNPSDFSLRQTSDPQNLQSPPSNPNNQPPVANAGGPYGAMAGTAVQFNGAGSSDPDGSITNYQWNFGDGTLDAGPYPTHAYASPGTYAATLTVTDNSGAQNSASVIVTITTPSNQPPTANPGGPYSALPETSIQFNGSNSSDADGTIVSYTWDFGDRTTATGPNPIHAYISPQIYQATLTVVDNEGAVTTVSFEVSITKTGGSDQNLVTGERPPDVGWGPENAPSTKELENERGKLPGHSEGNNNFQIDAPVLSLPGRGLDVNLNLIYNSLVWNKSGSEIAYDIDHDWPAPGWQLGFGKMVYMGSGVMIVEADGSRHGFTGSVIPESIPDPTPTMIPVFKGNTTDGSFIEYRCEMKNQPSGVARYSDGTVVYYDNFARGFNSSAPNNYLYPTMIVDANGNYIQIKYDWDQREPRMQRIVDTMGRIIDFHYFTASDGTRLLSAITTKGIKDDNNVVTTRTLVRLHYKQLAINTAGAFSGLNTRVYKSAPWVIDAIYYPATSTGYWFGDEDSYSSYGMIRKVVEQRGMNFSAASLTEMGTVTPGTMTREQDYAYPQSPSNLTKAPTFDTMTETWEGIDTAPPVTTFEISGTDAPADRVVTVTRPDGTKIIQRSHNLTNLLDSDPNKAKNGLVFQEEIHGKNNALLQKTDRTWEPGFSNTARLKRVEVTDELGQVLATDYDNYGDYNAVGRVREYSYDESILRTTKTSYLNYTDGALNSQIYDTKNLITPRLINLVSAVTIYTGDDANDKKAAITEYKYDEYAAPLAAYTADYLGTSDLYIYGVDKSSISGIFSHSGKFNPLPYNSTDGGGSGPDKYITKRGNVTKIIKYADPDNLTAASNSTTTRTYDMAGNIIAASSACCEQTSFSYELAMQYAYPSSKTRGSADQTSLSRVTTSTTYDFNTGLVLSTTDANSRTAQNKYDPASLRLKKVIMPTGARTDYDYELSSLKVTQTSYTTLTGTTVTGKNVKYLNGLGLVSKEESPGPDGTDIVETKYDQLGRLWKQSRPYRSGDTPQWSETVYDLLGRVISVRAPGFDSANPSNPNNTATSIFYNNDAPAPAGASSEAGQTAKTVDAWGRWRWTRLNSRGQVVEVVEPNPDGGDGFVTRYSYDTLDNLVKVEQGEQIRRFKYDALGRLTHQKLAETEATLNKDGERATTEPADNRWSHVLTYDERSNMVTRTDARGVRTTYNFNNDPLNRLQSISYDISRVNVSGPTVLPAPEVRFDYRIKSMASEQVDVSQVKKVTAVGVNSEEYVYDTEGRVKDKKITFDSLNAPMTLSYEYDNVGRLKQITYPEQYQSGVQNPQRKVITPSFDVTSRMDGLKVSGLDYASQISYNAASQLTSVTIGNGTIQYKEDYLFDPASGLLADQYLRRVGNKQVLMGFNYGYQRSYCQGNPCAPGSENKAYTGQVTRIFSTTGAGYDYKYDVLGRLQSAEHDLGRTAEYKVTDKKSPDYGWSFMVEDVETQNYKYDRYGNRTSVSSSSTIPYYSPPTDGLASLAYDSSTNRITTPGFNYDAAGNQTGNATGQTLIYDAAGRLAKVKDASGTTIVTYSYGSTNQRLISQQGDESSVQKTYYVWNGDAVISEYGVSGASSSAPEWMKNYIYFGSRLLATQARDANAGEIVQYHHPDRLGTRLVTNAADGSYFVQETMPFGTFLPSESSGETNQRFTSYDHSATTGLDYATNRFYDSRQGRFTQADPLGLRAANLTDPQSLNMYSYSGNDPINRVDPNGLFWGSLFKFLGGLFSSFRPNRINASFTYKSLPPISVSFSGNFQSMYVGFAGAEWQAIGERSHADKPNDCQFLASEADRFASLTRTTTGFMHEMKKRFLAKPGTQAYGEFRARGFKIDFQDDNNSYNQVRHFVGTMSGAYYGGLYAWYEGTVIPGPGADKIKDREIVYKAALKIANIGEDPNTESGRADMAVNNYSVRVGVDLALGYLARSQVGQYIRDNLCDPNY